MDKSEFYERLVRRPRIDVVPEEGEVEAQMKGFSDANDITLYSWRNDWLKNMKDNLDYFGYFNRDHSVKVFFNELIKESIILVGAGPSLAKNIDKLKVAKEKGIKIMAAHHAIMYLSQEQYQIKPDYVVMLDAGCMWGDYTKHEGMDFKDVPLLVDQTCNCEQLKAWEGPKFFYKSTQPETGSIAKFLKMEMERIIDPLKQGSLIEVGGHAMGAMMSLARGVMRAETLVIVGADYCFSPETKKFYPFDMKIDNEVDGKYFGAEGKTLPAAPPAQGMIFDIFGNMVETNGAYLTFKNVMDNAIKANVQATMQTAERFEIINACEGGALGALKGGLSKWMQYLCLDDAVEYIIAKKAIK